ncbi:MAG: phospholipid carrier-dependent glycosyltransferase [Candidatus Abyssobacteria bacterium SURF_5]|uniref:Phospholipid carrier-dependent glycosyltransferase n=1 Tax=Abyssobacteria bacterium (strain SURF_5) TaxID=2093360 RepID=A0A3A4N017_ABYX5|nr:MAG: phospholipid carrier-dependent glycosyltransferase [Candidatus Abyssubacteria bacterium SURF_5]
MIVPPVQKSGKIMLLKKALRQDTVALAIHAALCIFAAFLWGKLALVDAPFVYHPDEPDVVARSVHMILSGDLNPHWFHYPSLLFYINAAAYRLLDLFIGLPLEHGLAMGVRGIDPNAFVLYQWGRFITVCFSLGTLFLLLRLTSRLTTPLLACVAGFTFVGSKLVVENAASITVDMPVTFFALASLFMMVKFADSKEGGQPKERYFWAAMVLGGLAAGVKYNGAAVLFAAPILLWIVKTPFSKSFRLLALGALLSICVFFATTPYALLDMKTFLDPHIGMIYDFRHYSSGHPGADEGITFFKVTSDLFKQHSVLVIFALVSPASFKQKNFRNSLALMGFCLILFLGMVSMARVYFSRNILMAIPIADCLVVVGLGAILNWISSRRGERGRASSTYLSALAVLMAGAMALYSAFAILREQELPDTRTEAYEWLVENVPASSRILYEAYCPQLYYSGKLDAGYVWTVSDLSIRQIRKDYDLIVISEMQWARYQDQRFKTYQYVFDLPLLKEWISDRGKNRGPTLRVYSTGRSGYANR